MKITSQELVQRMMSEGIPEDQANKIGSHSGSVEELRLRVQNYLSSIDAENISAKTNRICKSTK